MRLFIYIFIYNYYSAKQLRPCKYSCIIVKTTRDYSIHRWSWHVLSMFLLTIVAGQSYYFESWLRHMIDINTNTTWISKNRVIITSWCNGRRWWRIGRKLMHRHRRTVRSEQSRSATCARPFRRPYHRWSSGYRRGRRPYTPIGQRVPRNRDCRGHLTMSVSRHRFVIHRCWSWSASRVAAAEPSVYRYRDRNRKTASGASSVKTHYPVIRQTTDRNPAILKHGQVIRF